MKLASLPRIELIAKMLGRSITDLDAMTKSKVEHEQKESGERVLEAKGLGLTGSLEPVDLELGVNEVLGTGWPVRFRPDGSGESALWDRYAGYRFAHAER